MVDRTGIEKHAYRLHFSARTKKRLAWFFWLASSAQIGLCLYLAALNDLTLTRFFAGYLFAVMAAAFAFASVGMLIVQYRPYNTTGWLLSLAGFGIGLTGWLHQITVPLHPLHPG